MDVLEGIAGQLIAAWLFGLGVGAMFRVFTSFFAAILTSEKD